MAKEFKEFDKRFAHLAGTALKTIATIGGPIAREDIQASDHWPWMQYFTEAYDRDFIAFCVYHASDAEFWQMFRVSLKGLNTYEKMYALLWYWDTNVAPYLGKDGVKRYVTRVNNYLGALKRSGHLNQELRVVKA